MKYCVYRHTCTINGKSYVGWTSRGIYKRWRCHCSKAKYGSRLHFHQAIRKHGKNHWRHDVLEESNSLSEIKKSEINWIGLLRTTINGYNMTHGGDGGALRRDVIEKANKKRRGVPTWNSVGVVMVEPFTLRKIREFPSIQGAQRILNTQNIWSVCNGTRNQAGGYHWHFTGADDEHIKKLFSSWRKCFNKSRPAVPVAQVDKDKNIITTFGSISHASKHTNINGKTIKRACELGKDWVYL